MKIVSFGYRRGLPLGDMDRIFDCRVMRNPHNDPKLRDQSGLDGEVQGFVAQDPHCIPMRDLAVEAVKNGAQTIAFGCYGGRHRSVAMAELVADQLRGRNLDVEVEHRDLE
ncbi:RNase adapter RapZ [Hyphomicrobium sp.]|uniref:RapZ C-terminal domain-containing protein n=1 Tax=Hyphomicrobium sp. TaxID=82 RepID=UPI001D50B8F6|nr:RNase adapter RapZ [Hyphomicrobium sp.]MBY0559994.1 hypothetical protein [Hyphomicrobium sp.]